MAPDVSTFLETWSQRLPPGRARELMTAFGQAKRPTAEIRLAAALNEAGSRAPQVRSMPQVLAYGGGADSFALLLDAIQRGEKPQYVVFCDVADSTPTRENKDVGEWPGTYSHIREIVMPLCAREGIHFEWLDTERYPIRHARSLFRYMFDMKQIPVSGDDRICTIIAKVERFHKWLNDVFPARNVEVWVGFEAGEEARVKRDPNTGRHRPSRRGGASRYNRFPLMERNMCRCRAVALIESLGYPIPRKSACQFCPMGQMTDWQTFKAKSPKFFADVAQMERQKPPTKKDIRLTIKGYSKYVNAAGETIYRYKYIDDWVEGTARPRQEPCRVCGAAVRATKEVGCDWLPGIDPLQRPGSGLDRHDS